MAIPGRKHARTTPRNRKKHVLDHVLAEEPMENVTRRSTQSEAFRKIIWPQEIEDEPCYTGWRLGHPSENY